MEEKLNIKIMIADRFYPLKIEREKEEGVRKAAKAINDLISKYKQTFAGQETLDYLAMAAFQISTELVELTDKNQKNVLQNDLLEIEKNIDRYLEHIK